MGHFPLNIEEIVSGVAEGNLEKCTRESNSSKLTLDYLEKLHNETKRVIELEIKGLVSDIGANFSASETLIASVDVSNQVAELRDVLSIAIESNREQVKQLQEYKYKQEELIEKSEVLILMASVLNKVYDCACYLGDLSNNKSLSCCVQSLIQSKELRKTVQDFPDWMKCSRPYKELETSLSECVLSFKGMVEYLLSQLVTLSINEDNTTVLKITPQYIDTNNSLQISLRNLSKVVDLCDDGNYFFQIMQLLNDMVICPILESKNTYSSEFETSDKGLICTVRLVEGVRNYKITKLGSILNAVISILEFIKNGVSIACGHEVGDKMLLSWASNNIKNLTNKLLEVMEEDVTIGIVESSILSNHLAVLNQFNARIETLIPGYSLLGVKTTLDMIQSLVLSKISRKMLNNILCTFVDIDRRDATLVSIDGRSPFYVHSYSVSVSEQINECLSVIKSWSDMMSSVMYKTIEEALELMSRDVLILYRYTEIRSLRESVLYNNDLEYINSAIKSMAEIHTHSNLESALSLFRNNFSRQVNDMLSIETELECHKVLDLIRSCDNFHVSTFGNFKAKSSLKDVVSFLRLIADNLSAAYSYSLFTEIMGKILDVCFSEIITILLSTDFISELESRFVGDLVLSFVSECSEIIMAGRDDCQLSEYVASYHMISSVLQILRLNLSEILIEVKKGSMDLLRGDSIKKLIISIFENSPSREKVLDSLEERLVMIPT